MTDDIRLNHENMSTLRRENLLKCSSEMTEGLMIKQVDKSYILNDVCESTAVDNDQIKIPNKVLERNKCSKYLVGLNKRFKIVFRIFTFVLNLTDKLQKKSVICQPGNKQGVGFLGLLSNE